MTYIHGNGDNHELCIEAYKRLVLGKTDLFDKSDLDNAQEIPVEAGIDDEDKHLRDLVPDVVDLDKSLVDRWYGVGGNPDAEDSDVDCSDENDGAPFDVAYSVSVLRDKGNSVDDNLHKQLNLEHPEE